MHISRYLRVTLLIQCLQGTNVSEHMLFISFLSNYSSFALITLLLDKLVEATDVIIFEHFYYDFPTLAALYLIHLDLKTLVLHLNILRECNYLYVWWHYLACVDVYDFIQWIKFQIAFRAMKSKCLHFVIN